MYCIGDAICWSKNIFHLLLIHFIRVCVCFLLLYVTFNDISVINAQVDWRRSWTYGWAPKTEDILYGSLTCPSKHWHGANLFIRLFWETTPFQFPFMTSMGIRWTYSCIKPCYQNIEICKNKDSRYKNKNLKKKINEDKYLKLLLLVLWHCISSFAF